VGRQQLILVVEDDLPSRMLATATLEGDGYIVDGAASAEEAVERIAQGRPDLILMDIQLPGMDGLELTKQLKADPATAGIPVLAVTGNAMPLQQRAAIAAGCEAFIAKPVSPAELSAEVRSHLQDKGA
jgi:two-component system, cell cycle response regulator DivK